MKSLAYKSAISVHTFSIGFSCFLPLYTKSLRNVQKVWIFKSKSVPTYRTRAITKKAYRTSVPYFLAKIETYRTLATYRTLPPSLHSSNFLSVCSINWRGDCLFTNCEMGFRRVSISQPSALQTSVLTTTPSGLNALVSGEGGLRFKSRTSQIGHSVTNGSPPLRLSSKEAVLPGRNDAEMGPANSLYASAYYSEYNERFDLI